jgi:hypothetical protein
VVRQRKKPALAWKKRHDVETFAALCPVKAVTMNEVATGGRPLDQRADAVVTDRHGVADRADLFT